MVTAILLGGGLALALLLVQLTLTVVLPAAAVALGVVLPAVAWPFAPAARVLVWPFTRPFGVAPDDAGLVVIVAALTITAIATITLAVLVRPADTA